MGKMLPNPKQNVFNFRADDDLAALIRRAAASYPDLSAFLREAARTKAENENGQTGGAA